MADINIERKEGRNIWPLVIIGLVLLALLAWWLMQRGGADRIVEETPFIGSDTAAERGVEGASGEVNSFIGYVEENRAREEAGLDHEYTRDGLHRLADALNALRREGEDRGTGQTAAAGAGALNLEQQIDRIKTFADSLQRNEDSLRHANHTRAAFTLSATVMETLQQRYYQNANAQVQQVRQASEGVTIDTPLLQQTQQVQTFFQRSSDAVRAMAEQGRAGQQTGTDTGRAGATPRQ